MYCYFKFLLCRKDWQFLLWLVYLWNHDPTLMFAKKRKKSTISYLSFSRNLLSPNVETNGCRCCCCCCCCLYTCADTFLIFLLQPTKRLLKERVWVRVCVFVYEREREREIVSVDACVSKYGWERGRERESVCECVRACLSIIQLHVRIYGLFLLIRRTCVHVCTMKVLLNFFFKITVKWLLMTLLLKCCFSLNFLGELTNKIFYILVVAIHVS